MGDPRCPSRRTRVLSLLHDRICRLLFFLTIVFSCKAVSLTAARGGNRDITCLYRERAWADCGLADAAEFGVCRAYLYYFDQALQRSRSHVSDV